MHFLDCPLLVSSKVDFLLYAGNLVTIGLDAAHQHSGAESYKADSSTPNPSLGLPGRVQLDCAMAAAYIQ